MTAGGAGRRERAERSKAATAATGWEIFKVKPGSIRTKTRAFSAPTGGYRRRRQGGGGEGTRGEAQAARGCHARRHRGGRGWEIIVPPREDGE